MCPQVSPKAAAAERKDFAASPRAAARAGGDSGTGGAAAGTPDELPLPLAATTDKFPDAAA